MAPGPIQQGNGTAAANGSSLKATAKSFQPAGATAESTRYHSSSSEDAIKSEATHAAHNYHPLSVGTSSIIYTCRRAFVIAFER